MPVCFLAIFTHSPSESAWLASSHASQSAAVAKAIGSSSSAATEETLTSEPMVAEQVVASVTHVTYRVGPVATPGLNLRVDKSRTEDGAPRARMRRRDED